MSARQGEIAEFLLERFRETADAARRRDPELEERFRGYVGPIRAASIDAGEQAALALDLLDASPLRRSLAEQEEAAAA